MNYYPKILLWLNYWDEILKEPNELLLEKSFVNLAKAATAELEFHLRKSTKNINPTTTGWKKIALQRINDAFQKRHPIIPLLKLEYNPEMIDLANNVNSFPFIPHIILPLVRKIKEGLSLPTLEQAILKELNKARSKRNQNLWLLTRLLLRKLVTKYSQRALKELLQTNLLREGVSFFLGKQIHRLKSNATLNKDLWKNLGDIYKSEINANYLKKLVNKESNDLYTQLDHSSWKRSVHEFAKSLNRSAFNEIVNLRASGKDSLTVLSDLRNDANLHKKFGKLTTDWYTQSLIKLSLKISYSNLAGKNDIRINSLAKEVTDFLEHDVQMTNQGWLGSRFSPNISLTAKETIGDAAASFLSENLAKEISLSDNRLKKIGKSILENLAVLVDEDNVNIAIIADEDLKIFIDKWVSRRTLHTDLKVYLKGITAKTFRQLTVNLNTLDWETKISSKENIEALWTEWHKRFATKLGFYKDLIHYLPWGDCKPKSLEAILNKVFNNISLSSKKFAVNLRIKKFNANDNKFWNFDDVIFYNPDEYNFGERLWFLSDVPNATGAQILVEGETKHEAGVKGWLRLQEVLNSFGLGLGVDQSWGGFDPEISPKVFVFDVSTHNWIAEQATSTRENFAIEQSLGVITNISGSFEHLLKSAKNPASLNELQKRVLSAFYWYRKGRWKIDPAESYINYWIGIESIFGESDRDDLFESVGRLLITWRDFYGHAWYSIKRMQNELLAMINSDLDLPAILNSVRKLSRLNQNWKVLLKLKNVDLLLTLIPSGKTAILDYAKNYRSYLESLKKKRRAIPKALAGMIENFHFKLLLLKDLRNRMAHEGIFYIPEMLLYNEKLEEIFESTLVTIGNEIIQPTPFYSNLETLITDGEKIFIT